MAIDKRIQALEDEYKVIRGELKQTLVNIRDFLLDINLPALQQEQEAEVLPEIHEHHELHESSSEPVIQQNPPVWPLPPTPPQEAEPAPQPPAYQGAAPDSIPAPVFQPKVVPMGQPPPLTIRFEGSPPPEETEEPEQDHGLPPQDTALFQEEEPPEEIEEIEQDDELPLQYLSLQEEEPRPSDKYKLSEEIVEVIRYPEHMNLLTNLIRWVAAARSEIGNEQLPAFLDVYSISGHLSSELREIIMHLAEIIAPKSAGTPADMTPPAEVKIESAPSAGATADAGAPPKPVADADVWSRMILELRGILSRGEAPFHPLKISWNGHGRKETLPDKSAVEVENTEDRPSNQPGAAMAQEDKAEDKARKKRSNKGKSKAKARRKGTEEGLSLLKENRPARLKLVLPLGDDGEQEFNIGGFSINLSPEDDGEDATGKSSAV